MTAGKLVSMGWYVNVNKEKSSNTLNTLSNKQQASTITIVDMPKD